ncbi:hypothetical protein Smp_187090, partial [Schistosoma mansoni]|uniref:hypothetical protein n=1 Tax=Schistosoma mansoni TaxID=6183 RepID=UPI00022DC9BB
MRVIHMAVKALEGDSKSLYEELALLGAKHAAIQFITSSDDYQQNYKMHNKKSRLSVATVPKEELDQIYPNCK